METKVFKAGDTVYDDVKVPDGNEFREYHEVENRRLHVEWYQGKVLILNIYVDDYDDRGMPINNQRESWWKQYLITKNRMAENSEA